MSARFELAKIVSATLTWGLRNVAYRPAANTPGKIALYVDADVIGDLRSRMAEGSVCVVGTNGKTTVTNLLANVLERYGKRVICNRTGANLDSGVATVLLQSKQADWGVFECDELWLSKILPQLQSKYVLLLNLFRDQEDRMGGMDRIQDSIVETLGKAPNTVLVYNADDPLCAMIAARAAELPGRENTPSVAFGVAEKMGEGRALSTDEVLCQRCSTVLKYAVRQYDQLGEYTCSACGFARPALNFVARDVRLNVAGLSFDLCAGASELHDAACGVYEAGYNGSYMVYNLMTVAVAASLVGVSQVCVQQSIDAFDPKNGRLQKYQLGEHSVLLNLAKNPTGFNQNLNIVLQDSGPKAVAFFVNNKEGDGRDASWIQDVNFESLAEQQNCLVFAGGMCKEDLRARLNNAGLKAQIVESIDEALAALDASELPPQSSVYAIANYTALPEVHAALNKLSEKK